MKHPTEIVGIRGAHRWARGAMFRRHAVCFFLTNRYMHMHMYMDMSMYMCMRTCTFATATNEKREDTKLCSQPPPFGVAVATVECVPSAGRVCIGEIIELS